jgi:hypothetical protein
METDFPLDETQSMMMLSELRDRLLTIHAAEVEAARAMVTG